MAESIFGEIKNRALTLLVKNLPGDLTYHNVYHTEDVLEQAGILAKEEHLTDKRELLLLKTAALFHDTGFLYTYKNHEEMSCKIAREELNGNFSEKDMDMICEIIMATKIPQKPLTHLAEILCDADLDYLGRDDFEPMSDTLRLEFLEYGIVKNEREWEDMQIAFFESHNYFTETAKNKRSYKKQLHLEKLKTQFLSRYLVKK